MSIAMSTKNIWLGIASSILAGAFWGLVFLTPALTRGFDPIQLSAGRYLAYGAIAVALLAPSMRRLARSLGRRDWFTLCWLSLAGNILYYVCLANGVQSGGVAMTSIVIGLLPITVTLAGSRDRDAVPLRRLLPSLLLSAAGLGCISWQSLAATGAAAPAGGHGAVFGLLCAAGALGSWTLYAVGNRRALMRLQTVSAHEWSLLVGVVTGVQALVLAVPAFVLSPGVHTAPAWLAFAGVMVAVALLCSVVGNALWNRASRLLPMALTGQMIVFETLFALLYGFLYEARWPTVLEALAMVLLVAGVLSCASAHRPNARPRRDESAPAHADDAGLETAAAER
jgi:drug/metabolite transporter (DMT)-like permease